MLSGLLFANEPSKKNTPLIKRTIAIVPFNNQNNTEKYNYLSDTIRDALKAKLLKTNIFNLTSFSSINNEIKKLEIPKELITDEENAKRIALKAKADVVVIGKYLIIEDNIMIQLDAIDIFTGITVESSNMKSELGLEIFNMIDEITNEMTGKMSVKLKMVNKTYFDEMMKILREKHKFENEKKLLAQNKTGIGLTASGSGLLLIGLPIFIYDLAGYTDILMKNQRSYESTNTDKDYDRYQVSYNIFLGLFCSGIILSVTGIVFLSVGIPLIFFKSKTTKNKISMNIEFDYSKIDLYIKFKL